MIDLRFTATIVNDINSGWTCVIWPESVGALGTGKAVKVVGSVDNHTFQATFLPIGGMHMLPLRAAILKSINKHVGDVVDVRLTDRL